MRGIDGGQLDVGERGDPIEQRRAIRRRLGGDEGDSHLRPAFQASLRTFSRQRSGAPVAPQLPVAEDVARVVERVDVLAPGELEVRAASSP